MQSPTYRDIIEDKITEWQNNLKKLEEEAQKAPNDKKNDFNAMIKKFRSTIATATVDLRTLDKNETAANTMETKEQILAIFRSIDTDFPKSKDKTPFML